MNAAQLDHTAKVLAEMLTFKQPSDAVLSAYFREHKKLGRQDRHEIAETAFAALRHYQKISTALRRPHAQPRKAIIASRKCRCRGNPLFALGHPPEKQNRA